MPMMLRLLAAAAFCITSPALAQAPDAWPTKPIRWIVTFAVGGGVDISARIIAPKMAELLGQQILIDNRPGAGGAIGTEIASKAPPDGYTLLNGDTSAFSVNPWLYKRISYDPEKDFVPIGQVISTSFTLTTHISVPGTDMKSFVAAVRAGPGKYTYGSPGIGSMPHLCAERFKAMNGGLDIVHVPYRGAGPVMIDLSAGQISMSFPTPSTLLPQLQAGTVRALGVGTKTRDPAMPDVPTLDELGLTGYECYAWFGLFAPAKTPDRIVKRLNEVLNAALSDKGVIDRLAVTGLRPMPGSTPAGFAETVKADREKWGPVVKALGMQLE